MNGSCSRWRFRERRELSTPMNPLSEKTTLGTAGELLVQLRLLQFGVQASAPLKDSGNDLIAVKERIIKTIQVKTTEYGRVKRVKWKRRECDLLAIVSIKFSDNVCFDLEKTTIHLFELSDFGDAGSVSVSRLEKSGRNGESEFELNEHRVFKLFRPSENDHRPGEPRRTDDKPLWQHIGS